MIDFDKAKTIPEFALIVLNELTLVHNQLYREKTEVQAHFNFGVLYEKISSIVRKNDESK